MKSHCTSIVAVATPPAIRTTVAALPGEAHERPEAEVQQVKRRLIQPRLRQQERREQVDAPDREGDVPQPTGGPLAPAGRRAGRGGGGRAVVSLADAGNPLTNRAGAPGN